MLFGTAAASSAWHVEQSTFAILAGCGKLFDICVAIGAIENRMRAGTVLRFVHEHASPGFRFQIFLAMAREAIRVLPWSGFRLGVRGERENQQRSRRQEVRRTSAALLEFDRSRTWSDSFS